MQSCLHIFTIFVFIYHCLFFLRVFFSVQIARYFLLNNLARKDKSTTAIGWTWICMKKRRKMIEQQWQKMYEMLHIKCANKIILCMKILLYFIKKRFFPRRETDRDYFTRKSIFLLFFGMGLGFIVFATLSCI